MKIVEKPFSVPKSFDIKILKISHLNEMNCTR